MWLWGLNRTDPFQQAQEMSQRVREGFVLPSDQGSASADECQSHTCSGARQRIGDSRAQERRTGTKRHRSGSRAGRASLRGVP